MNRQQITAFGLSIMIFLLICLVMFSTGLTIWHQLHPDPPLPINVCVIVSSKEISTSEGQCP